MWDFPNFYTSIFKKISECKMQLMNNGFNNIQNEWFNSWVNVNSLRDMRKNSLTYSSVNMKHLVVMYVLHIY
jgi:hypothetical protein